MSTPQGHPRRVSLGYILGFSDKPFKDPKPSSPPRPRRPSHLAELVASPGGIVEWTASDGRKGTLTGTVKPRLTAAALTKVPSNTRSAKAPTDPKAASKKAASSKHANNLVDEWNSGHPEATEEKKGSKKSVSKNAPSNKENAWEFTPWGGGGSTKASQKAASGVGKASNSGDINTPWGKQVVATEVETKQDEKKDAKGEVKSDEQKKTSVVADQAAAKDDTKKPDDPNAWTKEQDERMLQMKTEGGNIAWNIIATNVGKPEKECKERWKLIVPTGRRPNDAKKKSDKGDAGKKNDTKSHDQKGTNGSSGSKKGEDKKEDKDVDGPWGFGFNNLPNEDSDDKTAEEKKSDDWDTWNDGGATTRGNMDGASDANKDGGVPWDQTDECGQTGGNALAVAWELANQQSNNNMQEESPTVKPTSVPRSNKAPSEARTHRTNASKSKPNPNSPDDIELEPDDDFSANDLRLIARILQQDCSLVWNRVSWRFRDKTGRTLHPDVFEKKITGTVESKKDGT